MNDFIDKESIDLIIKCSYSNMLLKELKAPLAVFIYKPDYKNNQAYMATFSIPFSIDIKRNFALATPKVEIKSLRTYNIQDIIYKALK